MLFSMSFTLHASSRVTFRLPNKHDNNMTYNTLKKKGALAIRRIFSIVDKIAHTKFSNYLTIFEIGVARQKNVRSKLQDML